MGLAKGVRHAPRRGIVSQPRKGSLQVHGEHSEGTAELPSNNMRTLQKGQPKLTSALISPESLLLLPGLCTIIDPRICCLLALDSPMLTLLCFNHGCPCCPPTPAPPFASPLLAQLVPAVEVVGKLEPEATESMLEVEG